jgi:TonB family protein
MLIVLAAAISLPSEAPQPTPIKTAPWITTEDYPAKAVRGSWHGKTSYELRIKADGTVDECSITQSSGHPILDKKTCELLKKRARFIPPKDNHGNAMPSTYRSALTWGLPQEADGRNIVVTFRKQDGVTACIIEVSGRQRMITQGACDPLVKAVRRNGGSLARPKTFWLLDSTPLVPE